jgi:hypothetical protein
VVAGDVVVVRNVRLGDGAQVLQNGLDGSRVVLGPLVEVPMRSPLPNVLPFAALVCCVAAQEDLRLRPLPSLLERVSDKGLTGERTTLAAFVLACDLPAHAFDAQADLDRRRGTNGTTLAGHGFASLAARQIAEVVGCRSWLQVSVKAVGADRFVVDIEGFEINDKTWCRRSWALRAVADQSGRLLRAAYADSDLRPGELRELVSDAEGTRIISVLAGRAPQVVAAIEGHAPTLPAVVVCMLPAVRAAEEVVVCPLDWRTGRTSATQLKREGTTWSFDGLRVELDMDGCPDLFIAGTGREVLRRVGENMPGLRQRVVVGGALRFGVREAAVASVVKTKRGRAIAALGVEFDLPGAWENASNGMAPFDTVLCVEDKNEGLRISIQARPVDPKTLLNEFARLFEAPSAADKATGIMRFPSGKPQSVKIDGTPALLQKATINTLGKIAKLQELQFVADGIGYTIEVVVPEKREAVGAALVKTVMQTWKTR